MTSALRGGGLAIVLIGCMIGTVKMEEGKNPKIWRMSFMDDPLGRREGKRHFEHHVCSAWDLSSFHTLSSEGSGRLKGDSVEVQTRG